MQALEMWSSPVHIKHSLLSKHRCKYNGGPFVYYYTLSSHFSSSDITTLFLVLLSYIPASANDLVMSPTFISAVGIYISHLDPAIRRCGMLVVEEVANIAGKKLDFEDWEGENADKSWSRSLRLLTKGRDVDVEDAVTFVEGQEESPVPKADFATPGHGIRVENSTGPDSDDESLQGYVSEENSDRAPSPTPSELEEIEKDPTLNVGVKKIPKPVYLPQLGELVRSTNVGHKSSENDEPDKIEMALNCGEELIRRKRNFGMELGRCRILHLGEWHTDNVTYNRGKRGKHCLRIPWTTKHL